MYVKVMKIEWYNIVIAQGSSITGNTTLHCTASDYTDAGLFSVEGVPFCSTI